MIFSERFNLIQECVEEKHKIIDVPIIFLYNIPNYDVCKALRIRLLKNFPDDLKRTVASLEDVLGGKIIVQKTGHAYIKFSDNKQLEISLIAKGIRKFSTLIYLLRNGTISKGCTIFGDEAENNLNPKYMTKIANALFSLVQSGIQVVIVTHSLFLMKELSLLSEISTGKTFCRFFNCNEVIPGPHSALYPGKSIGKSLR